MRLFRIIALAGLMLGAFSTLSYAKTLNIKARAGAATGVYGYTQYHPTTCAVMAPPKVSFKQPKHGKFFVKRSRHRVKAGKRCAGRVMKSVTVYYRPNSGFRGKDFGKIGFTLSQFVDGGGYRYHSFNVNLTVR